VSTSDQTRGTADARYDVIVVSYNQRDRLLAGLASVPSAGTRLIVVDNDSDDDSVAAVRERFPHADLVALERNVGFGAAVNRGAARGDAPYILLLNNDARLQPTALIALTSALQAPEVVAAGPLMLGPDGQCELSINRSLSACNEARFKLVEALYRDGRGPIAGAVRERMAHSRAVRSLSGACMLLRRDAFERVGGFDERFFLYAEDVDLCLRLRQGGGKLMYVAQAIVEHDRGASSATDPAATALHYRRSQIAFYRKHRGVLATSLLRAYLALRFAIKRLVGRGRQQRQLAGDLLRLTLRETGK
jgi:GT2 family glycosyltransferase